MNVAIKGEKDKKGQLLVKTGKVDRYRSGKAPGNSNEAVQEEEDFVSKINADLLREDCKKEVVECEGVVDRRLERLARNRSQQKEVQVNRVEDQNDLKERDQSELKDSKQSTIKERDHNPASETDHNPASEIAQNPAIEHDHNPLKPQSPVNELLSQHFAQLQSEHEPNQTEESPSLVNALPKDFTESSSCSEDEVPTFVPKANRIQQPEPIQHDSTESTQIFQAFQSLKQQSSTEKANNLHDPLSIDDSDAAEGDEIAKEQEFTAWKQRQFARMQRDKQQAAELAAQQAELEAFRALPPAMQQQILDSKKALEAEQAEKKTKYKFLQKYYHKGAFFQDDDAAVLQRDYNVATVGEQFDKTLLPQAMQVKSFGKKGRSKWTHLTAEDTTAFDASWGDKKLSIGYKMMEKMGGMREGDSLEKRKKS